MAVSIDVSSFLRLAERFDTSSGEVGAAIGRALAAAQPQVEEAGKAAIRAVTPSSDNPTKPEYIDFYTDKLRDSTESYSTITGTVLQTTIAQPVRSSAGFDYGRVVREGRGAISGKGLLRTPWGPRWSVKAAAANPYPMRAQPAIQTAVDLIAAHASEETMAFLLDGVAA